MSKQWPRLLYSKDAPEGVLCTSDVHRVMLGPTWLDMPDTDAFLKPALDAIATSIEKVIPESEIPNPKKTRNKRGNA